MNYKKIPMNCNRVSMSCKKVHCEMMYNHELNNPTTSKTIGCWVRKRIIHNVNIDQKEDFLWKDNLIFNLKSIKISKIKKRGAEGQFQQVTICQKVSYKSKTEKKLN